VLGTRPSCRTCKKNSAPDFGLCSHFRSYDHRVSYWHRIIITANGHRKEEKCPVQHLSKFVQMQTLQKNPSHRRTHPITDSNVGMLILLCILNRYASLYCWFSLHICHTCENKQNSYHQCHHHHHHQQQQQQQQQHHAINTNNNHSSCPITMQLPSFTIANETNIIKYA